VVLIRVATRRIGDVAAKLPLHGSSHLGATVTQTKLDKSESLEGAATPSGEIYP